MSFAAPAGRPGQIERKRLLAAGAPCRSQPVMTIVAPAGYGKTTFATQWCDHDGRAVAWLPVSDADNDPVRLLHRLVRALEAREAIDPGLVDELAVGSPLDASLARLVDSMAQRLPLVLVLDDAHRLNRSSALEVLGAVTNAIPRGSQLVLTSRTEPPVPLARLRVAGDLYEVGTSDLALDDAETAEILEQAGVEADVDQVATLRAQTEGWPAAVALVAMAQRGRTLVVPTGRDRHLADYFTEEVLSSISEELRRFTVQTSVTLRICGPLCDAITGRDDSSRRLSQLAADNLFLVPLDEDRNWYRYHHLFQDLLLAELKRAGEDQARLLDRAATWHETYGDPAEALQYALGAGNFRRAGQILLGHWQEYANRGRLETLLLLLDRCREQDIESDPQLALGAGWVTSQLGDRERALRYLAAASRGELDAPAADGSSSVGAAVVFLRAALGPDGASQMLADGLSLVASELPTRTPRLVGAYRSLGVAEQLLGHPDKAIVALRESLQLLTATPNLRHVRVWCLGHLALAHADLGQWNQAESYTLEAETTTKDLEGRVYMVPALAARATIQATVGDRPGTLATLAKAAAAVGTTVAAPYLRAHLVYRFAEAAHLIGEDDLARDLLIEARSACTQTGDAGMIPDRLDRLEFSLLRVDPHLAALTPAERRVLQQLATHRTLKEIADHLFISRSTVKSHVASIYSKLAVASRGEAVATLGDRPAGSIVDLTEAGPRPDS